MEEYKRQFALNLLAYAVQRDISVEELCRLSGIGFKAFRDGAANIDTRQFNDLWLNAIYLSRDAAFGLHFGESLQLAALGVVGQIIQSSRTVGEALTVAAKSVELITDQVSMEVIQTQKSVTLKFVPGWKEDEADPIVLRHLLEFFMVFAIHEMDGLVLRRIKPLKAGLTMQREVGPQEYERVLRCKPQKSSGYTLSFPGAFCNEPIITANYDLQRHLIEMVNRQSKSLQEPFMSERVAHYLTANAYLGMASLEEIASNFNVSPRTLQRKLQKEGVSFQQLADSVRKSIAIHYLKSRSCPVKEVSYLLGYNELSAFTRAFKRWTGKTPLDYRRNGNDPVN
jgi:AraC-like DNA-binding protein